MKDSKELLIIYSQFINYGHMYTKIRGPTYYNYKKIINEIYKLSYNNKGNIFLINNNKYILDNQKPWDIYDCNNYYMFCIHLI